MRKLKQACKIDIRKAIDYYNYHKKEWEGRITITTLSERLNISRYVIYNMQHGIGRSYIENIEAVAFFCGIEPKDICPVDYSEQTITKK